VKYKLKDPFLVPPTGFEYTQQETGAKLDGRSLGETIMLVMKHRQANNLSRQTEQEVDQDVQQQICQQLGDQWCKNMAADEWQFSMDFDTIKAGTRTLMAWVTTAAIGGNPYCSQEEAEKRAAKCATCFANKRSGGCITCGLGNLIRALMAESTDTGTTSKDDLLQSCLVCGCLLQKKVHIRGDIIKAGISPKQRKAYSEVPKCWMNEL